MTNHSLAIFFLGLFLAISNAMADSNDSVYNTANFGKCLNAALNARAGRVIKVEFKQQNENLIYEFDIRTDDARDWDIECLEETAEIFELEEEVMSPRHPMFSKRKKVSLNEAKNTALSKHPGEVLEIEYELEEDGLAVYEFDIQLESGKRIKIEINAETGEAHEESVELWQIGYE